MTTKVKLLNIANIGPVLALPVEGGETQSELTVRFPCILGTDEAGDIIILDYLESLTDSEQPTVFLKANIISMNVPNQSLSEAYVAVVSQLMNDKPKVIVPENKIIL